MRVFVGFDDTDVKDSDRGTGKLARWFERELPDGCNVWGVVRQQLLVNELIPYTSHNSSACVILECTDFVSLEVITERAIAHIKRHFIDGSDPGLCVCPDGDPAIVNLMVFGRACAERVVSQKDALVAAKGVHLSGQGGTNDGIIGAAAAVGLTFQGWSGRFIEFGRLRDIPESVEVGTLEQIGIQVISLDRDAQIPGQADIVENNGWLRPRLLGGRPVLPVVPRSLGFWEAIGKKHNNGQKEGSSNGRQNLLQGTGKGH
ncbi:MAG: conserved hypothetical cytosolic protein [Deltaproteobacteria bacterium]|nr:conserved hypothetical cytosolic protein [Deltaproteobacteria bacterium]